VQPWHLVVQAIAAMVLHEFSHALLARRLGDPTATVRGRFTLNPLAHFSFAGCLVFPMALHLAGLPMIGWCKPMPVDRRYFANPVAGMGLVAFAGPAANFIAAWAWLALLSATGAEFARIGVAVNLGVALLNLLPLPGLDGWHIYRALWRALHPLPGAAV